MIQIIKIECENAQCQCLKCSKFEKCFCTICNDPENDGIFFCMDCK